MIQRLIQYFLLALFFCAVLSVERVIGLPLLFCVVWGEWIQHRTPSTQVPWIIGFGVVLASVYMIPLAVGMVMLAGLVAWLELSGRVVKQEIWRLLIGSEGVAVVMSLFLHQVWTPQAALIHLVKLVVVAGIVAAFLNRAAQRQGLGISLQLQRHK